MYKIFKEDGTLSLYGKKVFEQLHYTLSEKIASPEVRALTHNQLLILKSHLSQLVGDLISEIALDKKQSASYLSSLTDEEFEAYMKNKYGEHWEFEACTPEELDRVKPISKEELEAAMEEGRKNAEDFLRQQVSFSIPKIYYKK
jgi:predicted house-cleaning noncanonical NTP pyrophosphatase (MazG superfamily)